MNAPVASFPGSSGQGENLGTRLCSQAFPILEPLFHCYCEHKWKVTTTTTTTTTTTKTGEAWERGYTNLCTVWYIEYLFLWYCLQDWCVISHERSRVRKDGLCVSALKLRVARTARVWEMYRTKSA